MHDLARQGHMVTRQVDSWSAKIFRVLTPGGILLCDGEGHWRCAKWTGEPQPSLPIIPVAMVGGFLLRKWGSHHRSPSDLGDATAP